MARKFAHGQGRRWANKVYLKIFLFSLVRLLYPNTAAGGWHNYLPIFDRVEFQEEEEFKKSETHFGSLGPALPAGLSQILLTQTQGYIIALKVVHFLTSKFAWKITLNIICQYFLSG